MSSGQASSARLLDALQALRGLERRLNEPAGPGDPDEVFLAAHDRPFRVNVGTLDGALFLPGGEAAIGLDYQLSRHWALGVAVRQHFLFTKMSTYPSYTTAQFRVEYMWGY